MEDKKLPSVKTGIADDTSDALDVADANAPVSSYSLPQKNFPIENLEVHNEGSGSGVVTDASSALVHTPYSKRRAVLVSLSITTLAVLIMGFAGAVFLKKTNDNINTDSGDTPTQDISFGNAPGNVPQELEGSNQSLLVNGNIILKGELRVVSGEFKTNIRLQDLAADQQVFIPNASGVICLDSNNCDFVTQDQVLALQTQLNQIDAPAAGVSQLNGQIGAVSIQGTGNRVSVATANGIITLSTPQDLATGSSPTFSNLILTGSATLGTPLAVTSGGTGVATLTANGVLIGQGTGVIGTVSTVTPGECLVSTAGAPIWSNCAGASVATLQQVYDASATPAQILTSSAAKNIIVRSGVGFESTTVLQVQDDAGLTVFDVDSVNGRVGVGTSAPQAKLHVEGANARAVVTGTGNVGLNVASTSFSARGFAFLSDGNDNFIRNETDTSGALYVRNFSNQDVAGISYDGSGAYFRSFTNDTDAFQVQNNVGAAVLGVDTTNLRVGINTPLPTKPLEVTAVAGVWNDATGGQLKVNSPDLVGTAITLNSTDVGGHGWSILSTGSTGLGGAGGLNIYDNTLAALRMRIDSTGWLGFGAVANSPQALVHVGWDAAGTNLFRLTDTTGADIDVLNIADEGAATFRNRTNSTSAFQVQNAAGVGLINADTTNGTLQVGTTSSSTALLIDPDATGVNFYANGSLVGSSHFTFNANTAQSTEYPTVLVNGAQTTAGTTAFRVNQTGTQDIIQFQDNSANVMSVADGGAALFRNSVNSSTAFQIQNAAGVNLFSTDTTNTNIIIGAQIGETRAWTNDTSSPLTLAREGATAVTLNGYMYYLGGCNGGANEEVQYAKILADGSLGPWGTTTVMPDTGCNDSQATVVNGYIYVIDRVPPETFVRYAKPNADGTITSWVSSNIELGVNLTDFGVASYNGYIYFVGGDNGIGREEEVYYVKPRPDGSIPDWSTTTSLPGALSEISPVIANGFMYVTGGNSGATEDDVYRAPINADGTLGAWVTQSGQMGVNRRYHTTAVMNGYIYIMGGNNGLDSQNTVHFAPLNADGSVGAFTQSTQALPEKRWTHSSVVANNNLYVIGGSGIASENNTTFYTSGSRVQVAGGLDLVGLSGEELAYGGSGGHLTAGNTHIAGTLQVVGAADFGGSLATGGDLRVGGALAVRNTGDSDAAFAIQDGSGAAVYYADTSNNGIYAQYNNSSAGFIDFDLTTSDTTFRVHGQGGQNQVRILGQSNWDNVFSHTGSINVASVLNTDTGEYGQFRLQNATGSSLLLTDYTPTNLVSDPDFELSGLCHTAQNCGVGVGWGALPNAGENINDEGVTAPAFGRFAMRIVSTGLNGGTGWFHGPGDLTNGQTYALSFYMKAASGTFTVRAGHADDGVTPSDCTLVGVDGSADSTVTTSWKRFACTFVAGAQSGTPVLYFGQSDATPRTFYLDTVTLEQSLTVTQFKPGQTITYGDFTSRAGLLDLFKTDVNGLKVQVGSSTPDSVAVLHVLDSKSTAGDPTGINGSMYYNSNSNKFRCYENGAWLDCGSAGGAIDTLQQAYTASVGGTTSEIKLDGSRLSLDIQDADTPIGGNLFNIRSSNALGFGSILFGINGTGQTTFANTVNSSTAFQLQNAAGNAMLNVDSTLNSLNLVGNGGFESNTTGWTGRNATTLSLDTTAVFGSRALMADGTGIVGDGANFVLDTLTPGQPYSLSFYARSSNAITSNFSFGYACNASDETGATCGASNVSTANTTTVNSWTRFVLNFTPSTVSAGAYLFFKQVDATNRNTYIDNVHVQQTSSGNPAYKEGGLALNGTITTPLIVQPATNNSVAFNVQSANGTGVFMVDTQNLRVGIGTQNPNAKLHVTTGSNITLRASQTGTSDILELASNNNGGGSTNSVFNVNYQGAITAKNYVNSTTAFQVQRANANPMVTVDTLSASPGVTIGSTTEAVDLIVKADTDTGLVVENASDGSDWLGVWNGQVSLNQGGGYTIIGPGAGQVNNARLTVETGAVGSSGIAVKGVAGQTADLQQWRNSDDDILATIGPTGNASFRASTNSANAFIVMNDGGDYRLNIDTANDIISMKGTVRIDNRLESQDSFSHTYGQDNQNVLQVPYVDKGDELRFRLPSLVEEFSGSWIPYVGAPDFGWAADGRTDTAAYIPDTKPQFRITYDNIDACLQPWVLIQQTYPPTTFDITVETSPDGSAWTTRGTATGLNSYQNVMHMASDNCEGYYRFTFNVTDYNASPEFRLAGLQLVSTRSGDQGGTDETLVPYIWNYNKHMLLQPTVDATNAFEVENAAGTSTALSVDSGNLRLGIGTSTPSHSIHVVDATAPRMTLEDGSGRRLNLIGGTASSTPMISSYAGIDFSGNETDNHFDLASDGAVIFRNSTDSNAAFQIQNDAGNPLFTVDTGNDIVISNPIMPSAASTHDLGSTSAEWNVLYLGDSDGLVLGDDQDVSLEYSSSTSRAEITGSAGSLFIEDRLGLGKQSFTTAAGGAGTETLTPSTSYVAVTATDTGDQLQISETGANDGDLLFIVNVSASNVVNIDEATGGTTDTFLTADPVALGRGDSITLMYNSDLSGWVQVATSDN